ncbi:MULTISPECIES: lipid-A-disaccharide synthase [unclassified Achromobacter]|uniref:lipid-A-disaccharide synthase n=1 Tax=unclassified Achromobacter TaxID=2626865 RepID=UPI000B515533|nr:MULTISPECIES: lipid-A-disaccharide synthase [unclassified Achromobacter]OWT81046.1 lipid-A-disaccharide synthase [Achromobacter sp. HZ34]OWT82546.1 lipid-A-disaccharide synthase [Achromobacter sp. HZ28]
MVAGEPSGDMLAARIMQGLQQRTPGVICQGIGGPRMQAQGFESWHPMHALTVFGYVDALKRIPSLLSIYGDTKRRLLAAPPSVFVGIDAPDFNLKLELQLRQAGVPTVHFVGPSIWAWRYERIHKIREAVSHMLVLFPFEEEIYQKEGIPVTYVGHPLAGTIPMHPDRAAARARLGLEQGARVLAMLPGSRSSEIKVLAPRFLQALQKLQQRDPALQCVVPMVNAQRRAEFDEFLRQYPVANLRIVTADDVAPGGLAAAGSERRNGAGNGPVNGAADGQGAPAPVAWSVMEAADAVLVASGTATLEAALFKRPMVISYYLPTWMRRIMSWKSKQQRPYLPWVGLPNVLLRDFAVPELLQDDATPEKLAEATWTALTDDANAARVEARFTAMHQELLRDTPALAAQAIIEVSSRGSV